MQLLVIGIYERELLERAESPMKQRRKKELPPCCARAQRRSCSVIFD